MTTANWALLVPVLLALVTAITGYLKSRTAVKAAQGAAATAKFATSHSVAVSQHVYEHVHTVENGQNESGTAHLEGHTMTEPAQDSPAIDGATLMGIVPPVQPAEAQPAQEPVPVDSVAPVTVADPATDPVAVMAQARQALLDASQALEKIAQTF